MMPADFITVVSGLPRSGTSMMMQMLVAGGMPAVSDGLRTADADNPRGYFELEAVKKLKTDSAWLAGARGHAVKVISMLLYELPADYEYRVIFMLRDMDEILASQNEMLKRRGSAGADSGDAAMRQHLEAHLKKVRAWLAGRKNFRVLYCEHRELLSAPAEQARRVAEFLGTGLREQAMVQEIDPALHRNRAGDVRRI
jgi:hypothetical protein